MDKRLSLLTVYCFIPFIITEFCLMSKWSCWYFSLIWTRVHLAELSSAPIQVWKTTDQSLLNNKTEWKTVMKGFHGFLFSRENNLKFLFLNRINLQFCNNCCYISSPLGFWLPTNHFPCQTVLWFLFEEWPHSPLQSCWGYE